MMTSKPSPKRFPLGQLEKKGIEFIRQLLKAKDQEAYNKGRSEALDEEFDKAEKTSKVAEENYKRGYNDAKKGRKPAPHDTRDGYCCACDYDLACMEDKIKKQDQEADRRIEEVIGEIEKSPLIRIEEIQDGDWQELKVSLLKAK